MKGKTIEALSTDELKTMVQAGYWTVHATGHYGIQDVILLDYGTAELRRRGIMVVKESTLVFTDPN